MSNGDTCTSWNLWQINGARIAFQSGFIHLMYVQGQALWTFWLKPDSEMSNFRWIWYSFLEHRPAVYLMPFQPRMNRCDFADLAHQYDNPIPCPVYYYNRVDSSSSNSEGSVNAVVGCSSKVKWWVVLFEDEKWLPVPHSHTQCHVHTLSPHTCACSPHWVVVCRGSSMWLQQL